MIWIVQITAYTACANALSVPLAVCAIKRHPQTVCQVTKTRRAFISGCIERAALRPTLHGSNRQTCVDLIGNYLGRHPYWREAGVKGGRYPDTAFIRLTTSPAMARSLNGTSLGEKIKANVRKTNTTKFILCHLTHRHTAPVWNSRTVRALT